MKNFSSVLKNWKSLGLQQRTETVPAFEYDNVWRMHFWMRFEQNLSRMWMCPSWAFADGNVPTGRNDQLFAAIVSWPWQRNSSHVSERNERNLHPPVWILGVFASDYSNKGLEREFDYGYDLLQFHEVSTALIVEKCWPIGHVVRPLWHRHVIELFRLLHEKNCSELGNCAYSDRKEIFS